MRPQLLSKVTKEWIESIPKTINSNNCWIPHKASSGNGYTQIWIEDKYLSLHRLVLMLYHNIPYYNPKIVTRHGFKCNRACFNPEHLKPGTNSENEYDKVAAGRHHHANKTHCPFCGSEYIIRINKTGWNKGKISRRCRNCNHRNRRRHT